MLGYVLREKIGHSRNTASQEHRYLPAGLGFIRFYQSWMQEGLVLDKLCLGIRPQRSNYYRLSITFFGGQERSEDIWIPSEMFCVVNMSYDISKFYNHTKQHPSFFPKSFFAQRGRTPFTAIKWQRSIEKELSKTHSKFTN